MKFAMLPQILHGPLKVVAMQGGLMGYIHTFIVTLGGEGVQNSW